MITEEFVIGLILFTFYWFIAFLASLVAYKSWQHLQYIKYAKAVLEKVIFEKDGAWYFWSEYFGPFPNPSMAEYYLKQYNNALNKLDRPN